MSDKKENIVVEFRRDLVSGDWVLISSLRHKRPHFIKKEKLKKETKKNKADCPFEDPQKSGNPMPVAWYSKSGKFNDWFIQVIPNKYPLLLNKQECARFDLSGVYEKIEGVGFHEVVIIRDHNKSIEKMSLEEVTLLLKAYKERYRTFEKNKCIEYVSIFHNQGELAGASLEHPHSQIAALPITPPDVSKSINGAYEYYKKHKKCVHCVILEREHKEKQRVVFQNKHFITINPYASKVPYETRIFPLTHASDFEETPEEHLIFLAEALKDALLRINKALGAPDYNFFIHTAAVNVKNVPYYHWHIEIYPRMYKWAGFELGTGIEVLAVPPETATEELKKVKIN